jgi:predicted NAD/FAD-binding protein
MPMGAAIWSAAVSEMRSIPARSFLRFYANHGWLTLRGAPQWYTIKGGSRTYVEAVSRYFAAGVHAGTPVEAVRRTAAGAEVRVAGEWRAFDAVVLATHADQALRLLADPSPEERRALGAFRYSSNHAVLHTDSTVLPRTRRAWASWNSETADCRDERSPVTLTYHMNRLQAIDGPEQLLVSLNRAGIAAEAILAEMDYTHPILDAAAIDGQQAVQAINGRRNTYYCGAHLRYGFHEDGLRSALRVASAFGIAL